MYDATLTCQPLHLQLVAGEEREGQEPGLSRPGTATSRPRCGASSASTASSSRGWPAARLGGAALQHHLRGRGPHTDGRAGRQPARLARRGDAPGRSAEEAGLVDRVIPPDDRRATYAVITDKGIELLERAEPVLKRAVHRLGRPARRVRARRDAQRVAEDPVRDRVELRLADRRPAAEAEQPRREIPWPPGRDRPGPARDRQARIGPSAVAAVGRAPVTEAEREYAAQRAARHSTWPRASAPRRRWPRRSGSMAGRSATSRWWRRRARRRCG